MTMPGMNFDQADGPVGGNALMAQAIATGLWENMHPIFIGIGMRIITQKAILVGQARITGDIETATRVEAEIETVMVTAIEECIRMGQIADAFYRIKGVAERYRDRQTAPEPSGPYDDNHIHVTTEPTRPMVV